MLTVNSQPKPSADVALLTRISRLTLSLALWGVAEVQVALWFHQLNLSFFFLPFLLFCSNWVIFVTGCCEHAELGKHGYHARFVSLSCCRGCFTAGSPPLDALSSRNHVRVLIHADSQPRPSEREAWSTPTCWWFAVWHYSHRCVENCAIHGRFWV